MKNMFTIIVVAVLVAGLALGGCRNSGKTEETSAAESASSGGGSGILPTRGGNWTEGGGQTGGTTPGTGTIPDAGQGTVPGEGEPGGNVWAETDYGMTGDPELGDIVEDVTNPITGARVYEEMQETPYGLRSRVIVEYRGEKREMQPDSGMVGFSPDGRHLLYVHRSEPRNQSGTYLYNIETGRTQELVPSVPEDDPRHKPFPEDMRWESNRITYEKFGQAWTLNFNPEE